VFRELLENIKTKASDIALSSPTQNNKMKN